MHRKANRKSTVSCRQASDRDINVSHSITLLQQQNKDDVSAMRLSLQQQQKRQTASMGIDLLYQQKNENNASMGLAPPCEEMSLAARRLASPCEKKLLNARGLAPPSGSRLSATRGSMPPSPDTPPWVCTPARVPSPKRGVAGQTQTGMRTHFMAMECRPSIIVSMRKDARNIETTSELNYESTFHSSQPMPSCSTPTNETTTYKIDRNLSKTQCSNIARAIQGNFHQGYYKFGENAGNQCVPNCLIAGIYHTLKSVHEWTEEDMDSILTTGNELYSFLRSSSIMNHNHLMVHELPRQIEVFDSLYNIHIDESNISMITYVDDIVQNLSDFNALPLDETIQISLGKDPTAFVTFAGSTMLIGRTDNGFFIFDSHSRSESGMVDTSGKSTCLLMTEIDNISEHIRNLAESMNVPGALIIEVTGFKVENAYTPSNIHVSNEQPHFHIGNVSQDNDAITFSLEEASVKPDFKLLTKGTQRHICSIHDLKYENTKGSNNRLIKNAEKPKTWHRVIGDGNCFFRALSYAISNTEENHKKLRKLVCEHALLEPDVFASKLRVEHDSVLSYLDTSKMTEDCVWATEFEIFVASSMLDCTIYTFSKGSWIKFAMPSEDKRSIKYTNKIFLDHVNGNHYDVVLSAESKSVDKKDSIQYLNERKRQRKDLKEKKALKKRLTKQNESENKKKNNVSGPRRREIQTIDSSMERYLDDCSQDDKLLRNCKRKLRYMNDQTYRDSRKKISRRTYEENDTYRRNKILSNIKKYKDSDDHRRKLKQRSVLNYMQNEEHKKKVKNKSVTKYKENEDHKKKVKEASVTKYKENEDHKKKVKDASVTKYKENEDHKKKVKEASVTKYKENVDHKKKVKESSVTKYKDNEDHKNKVKVASVKKYKENEDHKKKVKESSIAKYKENEEHKIKLKMASVTKYKENEEHKKKVKEVNASKYKENEEHKKKKKEASILKYKENKDHRTKLKDTSISKYKNDEDHKNKVKSASIKRYREDVNFRSKLKEHSLRMYHEDEAFRTNAKEKSKRQNTKDGQHKLQARQSAKKKYTTDEKFKSNRREIAKKAYAEKVSWTPYIKSILSEKKKNRRILQGLENSDAKMITANFKIKAEKGPEFACSCCRRLCFDNQVVSFCFDAYAKKGHDVAKAATMSITQNFEHSCTDERTEICLKGDLKICHTCQRKIMAGCTPPESFSNNMSLDDIPDELKALNSLEENLIAKHISFMKLAMLPQGAQNAIHGPVVCIPSNLNKAASLPRQKDNDLVLRVKLKRKLSYKGHYDFKFVNTNHLYDALQYLKDNNKWYKDTEINLTSLKEENVNISGSTSDEESPPNKHDNDTKDCCSSRIHNEMSPKESEPVEEYGVQYDTCLQPADIGQEVLDHYFDEVYNLAPAEGMNPVKMLQEKGNEAKCFPVLFPTGKNSYDETRKLPISLNRYFNNRLMQADNRFAENTNYLFYAQYLSELKQVIEKTQISIRKSCIKGASGENITAEMLQDKATLKQLFRKDEALRFLQPIRGTPSFWQNAQKDLFAMLRQLGIPTWFCSFSAAEFRWKDIINTILKQQGDKRKFETLDWQDKCKILKSNPVTVARMFDRRFHLFLREVILSPFNPIGKVIDYFLRVEFQQRGSPHMHCLFWIEDAPKLNVNDKQTVCAFIDRYVTCELPREEDQEMHDIVQSVQQHSRNHSKSCRKKGTTCRFNFPRPPSSRTFIVSSREENSTDEKNKDLNIPQLGTSCTEGEENEETDLNSKKEMSKTEALNILKHVWDAIQSEPFIRLDTEHLLERIGLDQSTYEQAQHIAAIRQNIILKREPDEVWINQYNPTLLKCWDANMDIQFVLDPFSCIVYIISYISKAEREMGMILKQTKIESEEGNLNAHQTMKAIGSAYLHHREVGVQEAVYRVCGLKMKESSRKVVFIPVGENPTRLSKPLSHLQANKSSIDEDNASIVDVDSEQIWMMNVIDRYLARPDMQEFEQMCLAVFCSVFRVLSKSQVPNKPNVNVFKLKNDKGYIQRRVRSDYAVIRYPPTSISRQPEKHYRSILQLYLPYWTETQLKPPGFELYKTFYETGCVKFKDDLSLHKVQDIVNKNRELFNKNEDALIEAQELYDLIGEPTDAWAMLCPESERRSDECRQMKTFSAAEDSLQEDIADLQPNKPDITYTIQRQNASKEEILPVLRSLNVKQKEVFYFVRDWCLQKVQGNSVKPFHIFITGGAGTGKSHLIKAIEYEASRILEKICEEPDQLTVLLTAFTGTAAFNIQGCTVHHAFKIMRGLPLPYEALKEQTLSPLRAKLENLQILVIDEVSMIYKRLLYYIHERLVQIKRNKSPFGGISILAVGDFFQLPPVKQSRNERLYNENASYPIDYWNDFFSVIELDEIMRQREDLEFAKVLNMLRTRTDDKPVPEIALQILRGCEREGKREDLHVFSTNKEVNLHNQDMLKYLQREIIEIPAKDFKKDKATGKMNPVSVPSSKSDSDGLSTILLMSEGARVMLTRNIDVQDGLVNGIMGTVEQIIEKQIYPENSKSEVCAINIIFDNKKVGKSTGKLTDKGRMVTIERIEEELGKSGTTRFQYPLKLAWACTAHKVQGMTLNRVVVDLKKVFSPGQAYVALSRVTSKAGLHLKSSGMVTFERKIFADKEIEDKIESMKKFSAGEADCITSSRDIRGLNLILFNVQRLLHNVQQIRTDDRFLNADAIMVTETWLKSEESNEAVQIDNFTFTHQVRYDSYSNLSLITSKMKGSSGGGVGLYIRETSNLSVTKLKQSDIEGMVLTSVDKLQILVIYRPQAYPVSLFLERLSNIIPILTVNDEPCIIMGDFNENIIQNSGKIQSFMLSKKFRQVVTSATTENGTLVDHVYVSGNLDVTTKIMPTYYSDHEAVLVHVKIPNDDLKIISNNLDMSNKSM